MGSDPAFLVLGASGQVGYFLLQRLAATGAGVAALTRRAPPTWARAHPTIDWRRGDLFGHVPALPRARCWISAGPLDGLATFLERSDPAPPERLIALSSTSVQTKITSPDPAERALVARLGLAEETVHAWCTRHGTRWTVLRPTLVYGCGLDASLTPIARRARRLGWFPTPLAAAGLRQPVHADDVAAACLATANCSAAEDRTYALPGGECLSFGQMIARVLACLDPPPRVVELPGAMLGPALVLAGRLARLGLGRAAAITRMEADLTFDAGPAARDFGYAPRGFAPEARMFEPPA